MSFSIRLSSEEKALAESYAKIHSISLGEAFKRALLMMRTMNTLKTAVKAGQSLHCGRIWICDLQRRDNSQV